MSGGGGRSWRFVRGLGVVVAVWAVLQIAVPRLLQAVLDRPEPVPTPSTLVQWYLILAILAVVLEASTSDGAWRDFLSFLAPRPRGRAARMVRAALLVILPLAAAAGTFRMLRPAAASPVELRIQHPSTVPEAYARKVNPFRHPTPERLASFAAEEGLEGREDEAIREAFRAAAIARGRDLYTGTCQFCHGAHLDGNGPLADSLRLRPIDFTDPGTIATIVEGVALWRVLEGGPALPPESSPWDSAMPAWKDFLTEDDAWKVLLYVYDAAGVQPREPEGAQP